MSRVTRDLSQPPVTIDRDRIPASCPKCGTRMEIPFAHNLTRHLRTVHHGDIGFARPEPAAAYGSPPAREFCAVGPTAGMTGWINVIWLDFPYSVDRIEPGPRWSVTWKETPVDA